MPFLTSLHLKYSPLPTISDCNETTPRDSHPASVNAGYKVVFDNIDKNVQPRHERVDSKTKSLHYVHGYAKKDRIDYSHEPY